MGLMTMGGILIRATNSMGSLSPQSGERGGVRGHIRELGV
jgi:hypothetical protein